MSAVQTSMTIHFLGGGNMATAIIQGLSKSAPDIQLVVADPSEVVRARHQANGLKTHADIEECEHVQCIVLAVKPQYYPGTLKSMSHALHLMLSLCRSWRASVPRLSNLHFRTRELSEPCPIHQWLSQKGWSAWPAARRQPRRTWSLPVKYLPHQEKFLRSMNPR